MALKSADAAVRATLLYCFIIRYTMFRVGYFRFHFYAYMFHCSCSCCKGVLNCDSDNNTYQ